MNQTAHELYHHGVIGMKWGVRRYQPYGVGYDPEHKGKNVGEAAREAKAGKDPARHTKAAGQLMADIAKKRKQRAEERADDKEFRKAEKAKDKEFKRSERAKDAEAKRKVKEIEAERRRQEWMKEQLKKDQFKQQEREKARDDKRHDKEVANKAKRDLDNLKDQLRNQKKMQEVAEKDQRKERKQAEREAKKEARQEEKRQIAADKKAAKQAKTSENNKRGVDISKMSTEELKAYTNRINAENAYKREIQNQAKIAKENKDAGKSYVERLAKDVGKSLLDAGKQIAIDAGKKWIDQKVYEYTTPEGKKALDRMKKDAENLTIKNNYLEAKYKNDSLNDPYRRKREADEEKNKYYKQGSEMYKNLNDRLKYKRDYEISAKDRVNEVYEQKRYEDWLKKKRASSARY